MLTRLHSTLQRWASGRNVLIFLVLFLLFEVAILPLAGARLGSYSGGLGPIDLTFGLSPAQTYDYLTAYGPDGRSTYVIIELTADLLFPIVYGLFFSLAVALLYQRAFPADSPMQRLALAPLAGTLLDYLENIGIITMLLSYPADLSVVAAITAVFTIGKWLMLIVSLVLLIIGGVTLLMRRRAAPAASR